MKKNFILLGICLLILGWHSSVLAEESVGANNIIADVNLVNQGLIKQDGRNFTIGVNMQNKIGTQSGVLYGIQVFQTIDENRVLVDEYAFPDSLTIKKDEYVYREFDYKLPLNISGKLDLVALLRTDKGILLSAAPIKTVEVTVESVPVALSNCSFEVNTKAVKCTIINKTEDEQVIVLSTLAKYGNSAFASVAQVLVPQEIVLAANETRDFVHNIDEKILSRDVFFETTITDQFASKLIVRNTFQHDAPVGVRLINNVLINQTSEKNYNISIVSLSGGSPTQAKIDLYDEFGVCASKEVTLDQTIIQTSFLLDKACDVVLISVTIMGSDGSLLDKFETKYQTLFPQTEKSLPLNNTGMVVVVVAAFLALVSMFVIIRSSQNKVNIKA
jgi:hypothetical protein